ncbi:MAG: alpha/beta fold hydrolase [Sciscionella sp.]
MTREPSSFVDSGGLRLAVYEQGPADAPVILAVHGFPDNHHVWDEVATLLATRYRVITYDVRGAGRSAAPPDRAGYRLDALAADLTAVVAAVSPQQPVHLLAHDWGSIQAWHAVTDPRHVASFRSYTSLSGPCLDHVALWTRSQLAQRRLSGVLGQLLHSWYVLAFQLPRLPELAWGATALRARYHAERRDAVNGIELYRANMLRVQRKPQQRRTTVPVQQLVLARDAFVRPAVIASADPYCDRLWRRELDSDHWAPRSRPGEVASLTEEFLVHIDRGEPSAKLDAALVMAR